MKLLMIWGFALSAISAYKFDFTNTAMLCISAILSLTGHNILAGLLILITIRMIWLEYGFLSFSRIKSCPGCVECDPQAFIAEDGEADPGINNFRERSRI